MSQGNVTLYSKGFKGFARVSNFTSSKQSHTLLQH